MLWWILIPLLMAFVVWYVIYRAGNPSFWKLASKFPDEAFDWSMAEDCWVVLDPSDPNSGPPAPRGGYTGPFLLWIPKLGGKRVKVYGKHDQVEASQERFKERIAQRTVG